MHIVGTRDGHFITGPMHVEICEVTLEASGAPQRLEVWDDF